MSALLMVWQCVYSEGQLFPHFLWEPFQGLVIGVSEKLPVHVFGYISYVFY